MPRLATRCQSETVRVCLQSLRALTWAEDNPLSEYQKEYYRKQLLRHRAGRAQVRDAGVTRFQGFVLTLSLTLPLCSDRLFGNVENALRLC